MIANYFKTAWRNLKRHKLYSLINITGLSIGIACCIFIFLYVRLETSYDKYNVNAHRIYRLTEVLHMPKGDNARAVTSPPMAVALQANFPEIEKAVRINFSARNISNKERKFNDTRIIYADSTFFEIFTLPMQSGNPEQALTKPYSIVLTSSAAKKYFANEQPLGKFMQLSDSINLTVTGIINDIPKNSHFNFDAILSNSTMAEMNPNQPLAKEWYNNNYYTYLLLPEKHNPRELETRITSFIAKEMAEQRKATGLWYDLKLQPLTDIHLKSDLNAEIQQNGDITYVYIFSAAAILILLIACSNFINLSTAKSINRGREIGLRKVIGARRSQLIAQFLGESFFFVIISAILSVTIVVFALPFFNSLTGESLSLSFLQSPVLFLVYAAIILVIGLLAGTYPAFLMSSFRPVHVLKGALKHGWKDIFLRKGLVIIQFTIAIILIAGTGLIFEQMRFIQNRKLGLNKEQVLEFELTQSERGKEETLLKEISKNSGVISAGLTDFTYKYGVSSVATIPEGFAENEVSSQKTIIVDDNFLRTFQIELAAGRDFSKLYPTDIEEGFMVNETAVKEFGWKSNDLALGKGINWGLGKKGKVIGVVKDFNFNSLHEGIKPLIMHISPGDYGVIAVRIKPENVLHTIKAMAQTRQRVTGESSLDYTFLDEDFAMLYKSDFTMRSILSVFTILSIIVACLGLFGLTVFTIRQRYREVGIRKVLGASVTGVVSLLSKDLLKLIIISIAIATPVAWFCMNKWLENFAYRIQINAWIFLLTGISALLIAFLTVSFHAIRAAITNPVKSLRTE
jgi:putative ABC transport system permease protein